MITDAPISLFTSREDWTELGFSICQEFEAAILPILKARAKDGVRLRDLEYIGHSVVTDLMLSIIIERRSRD